MPQIDTDRTFAELTDVEIFRVGKYPQGEFTEKDLQTIADEYDPALHEAPVTLDHTETGPALGWVSAVKRQGNTLFASLRQVSQELMQFLKEGRYKKRSVEIYSDFQKKGKMYLKALTFLGAQAPQVKGMANIFSDKNGDGVRVEVDNLTQREDKTMPDEKKFSEAEVQLKIQEAETKARAESVAATTREILAKFGDGDEDAESVAKRLAEAEAKNIESEKKLVEHRTKDRELEVAAFLEEQIKAGKMIPAEKESYHKILAVEPGDEAQKAFQEGQRKAMEDRPANYAKLMTEIGKTKKPASSQTVKKYSEETDRNGKKLEVKNLSLVETATALMSEHPGKFPSMKEAIYAARNAQGDDKKE